MQMSSAMNADCRKSPNRAVLVGSGVAHDNCASACFNARRTLAPLRYLFSMPPSRQLLTYLIAGWSGYYVMAIELLSGRILAPNFGNSIYVWGGIITVFMVALSVGYLVGGQLSVFAPSQ